jgi:hypothetical protein
MNTNILQKCVDELKKDTPNLSYVQGMLETVIEMTAANIPYSPVQVPYQNQYTIPTSSNVMGSGLVDLSDEEVNAQRYESGPLGQLSS